MPIDTRQERSGTLRWNACTGICFVLGTVLWWPLGLFGIIGLAVADRWLQACALGVLLDLAYHAPDMYASNVFGFPFLGIALIANVAMYVSQRAMRRASHALPGVHRVSEDAQGML